MQNKKMDIIRYVENKVKETIDKYKLINKDDKIIVACSGGKDSITTLHILNKFGYDVEALIIDLLIGEWSKQNLENTKKFCKDNHIKLHVVDIREELGHSMCYIRSLIQSKQRLKNCMICGVIKRWLLNKKARELKADKLTTGHNLDDEAETIIMNIINANPMLIATLGPKTGIINSKRFVQRIKPLYFCTNNDIKQYSLENNFPVVYKPCPCSFGSIRKQAREFLAELEKHSKNVKYNLVMNFLNIKNKLKTTNQELKACKICGEPSRNEICKACKLINIIENAPAGI